MSISVYAHAIIGVKLPRAPFEEKKVAGCSHGSSTRRSKFCGECGEPAWETERQRLEIYDEESEKLGEFNVLRGGSGEDPDYYVGLHPIETEDCMYGGGSACVDISGVDFAVLESQLKKLLEPHKLWARGMHVRLWVFGYIS